MAKKWYILHGQGEDDTTSIVELSDEEFSVLKNIMEQSFKNTVYADYLNGNMSLIAKNFDTKKEAYEYALTKTLFDEPQFKMFNDKAESTLDIMCRKEREQEAREFERQLKRELGLDPDDDDDEED